MRGKHAMSPTETIVAFLAASLAVLASVPAAAQDEAPVMVKSQSGVALDEHDPDMCHEDGVGVGGYDLVSYRQDGGPLRGDEQHAAEHADLTYLFANVDNRDAFLADPERYLPAYSGFCAITLALGRVTCPEYTNFKIENDELLLFEVTGFTNGRTLWNSDTAGYRQQADDNFKLILETE